MLATSYLPGRWPSKYCHRNESFRPCSGWEREFSSRLVTSEFFEYAQNCIAEINLIINFFPLYLVSSIFAPDKSKICSLRSTLFRCATALHNVSCPVCLAIRQANTGTSHRLTLGKALVLLVSLDLKCCHSYICDLSTL